MFDLNKNGLSYIIDCCDFWGGSVALIDASTKISYADLAVLILKKVDEINMSGHDNAALVFSVNHGADDIVNVLAGIITGRLVVPLYKNTSPYMLDMIIEDLKETADILVDKSLLVNIDNALKEDVVFDSCSCFGFIAAKNIDPLIRDPSFVIFTSGTSGRAKGVLLSTLRLIDKLKRIQNNINVPERAITITPLGLNFIFGLWVMLLSILRGCTIVSSKPQAMARLCGNENENRKIWCASVPSFLCQLKNRNPNLKGLITTGGEFLSDTWRKHIASQWPMMRHCDIYGLTETGSCDFFSWQDDEKNKGNLGQLDIAEKITLDPASNELLINSPFCMLKYINNEKETSRVFKNGYFCTGDIVSLAEKGSMKIVGRLKDIIIRNGIKISPVEIEEALLSNPLIHQSIATSVYNVELDQEQVVVGVVPIEVKDKVKLKKELEIWMQESIKALLRPDSLLLVDKIPQTENGKKDRESFRQTVKKLNHLV